MSRRKCQKCGSDPYAVEWHQKKVYNRCVLPGFSQLSAMGEAVAQRRDEHMHHFCRCGFDWTSECLDNSVVEGGAK